MREPPRARLLPDGRRLHLQDGPIDLVIEAFGSMGEIEAAYRAAAAAFAGTLDGLCAELAVLRAAAHPTRRRLDGPVARRMEAAVAPFATDSFITPMAAVAGAVADAILAAMLSRVPLRRATVNNGGDIALHCAPGEWLTVGLIDRPDRPRLFGTARIAGESGIGGVATSGWRGRSFSRGIADGVTILARSAAEADAAATVVANAVDLPGHPAVLRVPADRLQPDTDLGSRLVTRAVGPLGPADIASALGGGLACADGLLARGLILGAALQLQGTVRVAPSSASGAIFRDLPLDLACGQKVADGPDEGAVRRPLIPAVADFLPGGTRGQACFGPRLEEGHPPMPEVLIRKRIVAVEEIFHEGGPPAAAPLRRGSILAVIANPFAGRYVADITGFMSDLEPLGLDMARALVDALGGDPAVVEGYGKGAIVGQAGEVEHGALWHAPGGYAMRGVLGEAKAIVPSTKKVGGPGTRLDVPVTHINASYVRSHFDGVEVGVADAPRAHEIVLALVMTTGPRIHARAGGLQAGAIKGEDGLR